jgi:hypothetical protein
MLLKESWFVFRPRRERHISPILSISPKESWDPTTIEEQYRCQCGFGRNKGLCSTARSIRFTCCALSGNAFHINDQN